MLFKLGLLVCIWILSLMDSSKSERADEMMLKASYVNGWPVWWQWLRMDEWACVCSVFPVWDDMPWCSSALVNASVVWTYLQWTVLSSFQFDCDRNEKKFVYIENSQSAIEISNLNTNTTYKCKVQWKKATSSGSQHVNCGNPRDVQFTTKVLGQSSYSNIGANKYSSLYYH